MSTLAQVIDRAQLIAMSAEGVSSPKYDNDWIAELLYPSVMKKVIIEAGNDQFRAKDVRITQNISVTSGVGTLPTNVALECIETANVQYAGAATWATTDIIASSAVVAGAGTAAANGVYTYRGESGAYPYFNLVGQASSTTLYAVTHTSGEWRINNSVGSALYTGTDDPDSPWNVGSWADDGGISPTPTVTYDDVSAITITAHGFTTGEQVTVSTSSALPTPLVINTVYYVIVVDDNTIQLATTYERAIAGTNIALTSLGAGTGTITPQTLPPASYVRDYNDYLRPLPDIFSYWTTQGGSFYYKLITPSTARARAAFTGTIPFNSVVFPIVSSNEVSIVAGTSLASDIVDDIVTALASAIRGEVSLASQIDAT